jgi:hypothetical protein
MKTSILLVSVVLAAPVAVSIGCASDPNKKLQTATAEEAEAAREQQIKSAEAQKDQQIKSIEKRTDRVEESASALPQGSEQRAKAQAQLTAEREKYRVEAQTRLQKINAKLDEARRKLQIAGGRAATSTHDKVDQAAREAASVAQEINALPQVRNEAFGDEKKRIDARLDQVEAQVDEAKSKVDDAMP